MTIGRGRCAVALSSFFPPVEERLRHLEDFDSNKYCEVSAIF